MKKIFILCLTLAAVGTCYGQGRIGFFHRAHSSSPAVHTNSLNNALVTYQRFDEASGARVDATGNGHTLSDAWSNLGQTTGQITNAAAFLSGTRSDLYSASADFNAAQSFTQSAWVKIASGTDALLIGQWSTNTGAWDYVLAENIDGAHSGVWSFVVTDSLGGQPSVSAAAVGAGTWHLLACGYDSTNGTIWISLDGGARTSQTLSGRTIAVNGRPFTISNAGFNSTTQAGDLDDLAWWSRVLTGAELADLYNRGKNGPQGYQWDGNAPPLTCQPLASSTTWASSVYTLTLFSQKIKGSPLGMTVCGGSFLYDAPPGTAHLELRENPDGTGAQYGASSDSISVSGNNVYSFTWSTPASVPSNTDFFMCLVSAQGAGTKGRTADSYFPGEGYDGYDNGVSIGYDWYFSINTMQP